MGRRKGRTWSLKGPRGLKYLWSDIQRLKEIRTQITERIEYLRQREAEKNAKADSEILDLEPSFESEIEPNIHQYMQKED